MPGAFIPLIALFIIALIIMLVGLRLSSRTLAASKRETKGTSYRRGMRQGYPSKNVSRRGSPIRLRGVESYESSIDYRISGKVRSTRVRSSEPISGMDISLMDLTTYIPRELISNSSNVRYALKIFLRACLKSAHLGKRYLASQADRIDLFKQALRKYSSLLLLILSLGLILSISLCYLYNTFFPSYIYVSSVAPALPVTKPYTLPRQLPQGVGGASKAIKRLAQLDSSQYSSEQEYNVWSGSACSATAMTEVINAYGHSYRITDILHVEISQSAISSELGLLKLNGIDRTVAQFGFSTVQLGKAPLDSVISVANSGWPVIVDFPPGGDWPTGHFPVITGGNSDSVFLADSSPRNFTAMARQQFLRDWAGFAVVVMPKKQ